MMDFSLTTDQLDLRAALTALLAEHSPRLGADLGPGPALDVAHALVAAGTDPAEIAAAGTDPAEIAAGQQTFRAGNRPRWRLR
ncbi:hypothetical protein ACQP00_18250 [Dactylosporangium sp. CS-047395]|uniref:hypothetical protein n=1 Tax=Dactylosporangium sp. CS-047395 TaxID=3239936 RepID=UPI003D925C89